MAILNLSDSVAGDFFPRDFQIAGFHSPCMGVAHGF